MWTGFHPQGEALSLDQYLASRHVAAQFGDLRVPTFESWFLATHQARREVVASASSFYALPLLVVGTQRIATMHTRLARMYARLWPVKLLSLPFGIPTLTRVAQRNRSTEQDAALAWLRDQLLAVAGET